MIKKQKGLTAAPREPERIDAAFVAWMLRISPIEVFPLGADITEEDDAQLILQASLKVDDLVSRLNAEDDGSPDFKRHRELVLICASIMDGRSYAPPKSMWGKFEKQYGRGIYLSHKAHLRRESRE
ncbi:hypothetical protein [Pseudoxanthomonas sp. 10H]|uniref:hypothetical protein n=1 Tax=Pseudoxanthomonas sp. 10H TaxID=3242729 RepID=UPI0035574560